MADITQSFSQLLLTYGPGAMLDLPEHAVVVAGLQGWRYTGDWTYLREDRLVPLLRQQLAGKLSPTFAGLRQPPAQDEERHDERAPGIDVLLFPTWFTADSGKDASSDGDGEAAGTEKRRRMVGFSELSVTRAGKLSYASEGGRVGVNPIRFVAACARGHLQDIDWRFLAHRNGGDLSCRKPLYWVERGVSSDPADLFVRCTCGATVSLGDLYKPKFLGTCSCQSPWLQPRRITEEICQSDLKLLPRSATNTYFPQTITVISLSTEDSRVREAIREHRGTIDGIRTLPNFLTVLRLIPTTKEAFAAFSDADIERTLAEDVAGEPQAANPRIAEFDLLASGKPVIGHDSPGSFLFAETLDSARLGLTPPWNDFLSGIVRVHRLREVTCLYGFTRLEPPPTSAESELDEIQLSVDGADLAREVEWLPALEQYGEGVFLHFSPEFLAGWMARPEVAERAQILKSGETRDAHRFNRPPRHLGIAYWALHSLSHALLAELALECGYPLSSLKERIYASGSGQPARFGLLVYTSTAGGQGTLGGLSSMAERVPQMLSRALNKLVLCSNDPICSEHSPDHDHGDRPLQGAACHACLLIPETSCEARNSRLDRSLLVETVVGTRYALFADVDANALTDRPQTNNNY